MVSYATPKGPFTAAVIYGPSEDDGKWAGSLKYSAGGMEGFVAAIDNGDNSDYTATKFGGAFKSGMHKVVAQYELTDNGSTEPTVLFVGYQAKVGKNVFAVQYGDTDPDSSADNTTYVGLGVIHKMSKLTRAFAGWRDTSDVESVISVGLRKDFK